MDGLNGGELPSIHPENLDRRQLGLILGLRWKLLVRDARTKPFAFALRMFVALGLLIGGSLLGIALALGVRSYVQASELEQATAAVHLAYLFAFLWLGLGPLIAFGANEFLDVTKLFVLPVSHRTVFTGSLAGAFLSPATFIAGVPVFATSFGFVGGVLELPMQVFAGLGVLVCAVATGEVVKLLMLNILRSRLWRDVMLIVGPMLAAGFYLLWQLMLNGGDSGPSVGAALARVLPIMERLVISPSWWGASAATAGDLTGLIPAVVPYVVTVVLVRIAARLQKQAYHGEVAPPASVGSRPKTRRSPFVFLRDPIRALAEKDLKLLFREPVVRMLLIQQGAFALFPVGLMLFRVLSEDAPELADPRLIQVLPFAPLVALLMLFMEIALLLNLLGLEGGGIAHTLLTPVRGAQILWGKVISHLFAFGTLNAVVGFVVAVIIFSWAGQPLEGIARGLLAAVVAYVATAVALSITVIASVYLPIRLTSRDRKALRQQAGGKDGCLAAIKNLFTMGAVGFAVMPLVVLAHAADIARALGAGPELDGWLYVIRLSGVTISVLLAALALKAGVTVAAKALEHRFPAVVERLTRTDN